MCLACAWGFLPVLAGSADESGKVYMKRESAQPASEVRLRRLFLSNSQVLKYKTIKLMQTSSK